MDNLRGVGLGLFRGHLGIGDQDDNVVLVHQVRGCPVDANDTGAALAGDGIGLQARTVGHVYDCHELAGKDIGSIQEVQVNGDRSYVVQVGVRDGGPVDFGLEHCAIHNLPILPPAPGSRCDALNTAPEAVPRPI